MNSRGARPAAWLRAGALVTATASLLLIACGGKGIDASLAPGGNTVDCSPARLKGAVLDTARQWYLFPELLPASIDPAAYATVDEFLAALTAEARALGRDRFFSGTTSIAAENQLLQGQATGFGFTLLERAAPPAVLVGQVFSGSPAAEAGFARGDALLAIGASASTLQPIEQVLANAGGLEAAIGPSADGVVRVLRWRSPGGVERTATLTKRSFAIDAVPATNLRVLTLADGRRVGHLTFRSFVTDAVSGTQVADLGALRSAFARFGAEGVRDVIVDLRYNGGGLVSIASLLLDLLAGDRAGQVAFEDRYNAQQASRQQATRLSLQPQTVPTLRVAFVVSERTASASELVINAVAPYARTAIVGTRTFGKPVGQLAFDVAACDFRLRLVAFLSVNRNGDGDYYQGLPYDGFTRAGGTACAATDDLSREPGDPAEAMTAQALSWIGSPTGECSAGPVAHAGPPGGAIAAQALAPVQGRGVLQYYLPGTF